MTEIEMVLRFPIGSYCTYRLAGGPPILVGRVVGYCVPEVDTEGTPYHSPDICIMYPDDMRVYIRDPRYFIPCDPPPDGEGRVTVAREGDQ